MRFFRQDLHTLTGAYALDALDSASESARFSRHLSRCQSCAAEVRGLREVATAMAFAATTEAPAAMRERVMTAAARTRQLPPEIRTHVRPRRTRGSAPWIPWLSGAVATAAIAVAVFFGFSQAHTQDQLNAARAQSHALAAEQARVEAELTQAQEHDQALAQILGAPHVTLLSQSTSKGGVAVVVLDAATRKLVVATSGLPGPARGPGLPAVADRPGEDRLGRPAADGPGRGDHAGGRDGHRQGRQARPDRRAGRRLQPAHHQPDRRPAPAGLKTFFWPNGPWCARPHT